MSVTRQSPADSSSTVDVASTVIAKALNALNVSADDLKAIAGLEGEDQLRALSALAAPPVVTNQRIASLALIALRKMLEEGEDPRVRASRVRAKLRLLKPLLSPALQEPFLIDPCTECKPSQGPTIGEQLELLDKQLTDILGY